MVLNLNQFGPIMQLTDPAKWKEWGLGTLSLLSLSGVNIPVPTFYDDWRRWAAEFNGVLDSR